MPELTLTNKKCPVCEKEEGLVKEVLDGLKKEGKLKKELFEDGVSIVFPLIDPTRPPILLTAKTMTIPVLNIYLEVCDCGCVYCTKFDFRFQQVPVQYQQVK